MAKFDIGVIAGDERLEKRVKKTADIFEYSLMIFGDAEDLNEEETPLRVLIIGTGDFKTSAQFEGFLKKIKTKAPDVFKIFIATRDTVKNAKNIAKAQKIDLILNETEIYETSKPEYIFSQVVRATYLPIKPQDVVPNTTLLFDIYHLLPQQQKFLKFCFKDDLIDQKRSQKLTEAVELYIHRDDAENFAQYLQSLPEDGPEVQTQRCRARFMALYAAYMRLVFALTEQNLQGSFQLGIALYEKCKVLAHALIKVLEAHPNPWQVVHSSIIGDFGSVERGPAVASYAGIVASKMQLPNVKDIMICALLSELGLLFVPTAIAMHVRSDTLEELTEEQITEYHSYPKRSIAVCLDRKIQLSPFYRNVIMGIHERADKTGFPMQRYGKVIPLESMLLHFAFEVDRRVSVKMGKARIDINQAIKDFLVEELEYPSHFEPPFVVMLNGVISDSLNGVAPGSPATPTAAGTKTA